MPLWFYAGIGLIALVSSFWIIYVAARGRRKQWAEDVAEQVRTKNEEEARLQRQAEADYLAGLPPEEDEEAA